MYERRVCALYTFTKKDDLSISSVSRIAKGCMFIKSLVYLYMYHRCRCTVQLQNGAQPLAITLYQLATEDDDEKTHVGKVKAAAISMMANEVGRVDFSPQ